MGDSQDDEFPDFPQEEAGFTQTQDLAFGEDDGGEPKCVRRGCHTNTEELVKCAVKDCNRFIHPTCFEVSYILKKGLAPLGNGRVACMKKCYDKAKKAETCHLGWNEDAATGIDGARSSERILLDWLIEPGNYAKFRGKDNQGVKKKQYTQRIAFLMNQAHMKVTRDSKMVLNKIKHLEDQFCKAHDFANTETGAGLIAAGTFQEEVEKICPFYYDLLPIMGDRSATQPKVTSDTLLLDDSDEDEEDDDLMETTEKPKPGDEDGSMKGSASMSTSSLTSSSKRRASRPSPPSSGKKIALLDEDTQRSLRDLTKLKMSGAKWESKQKELDYKMQKLARLKTLRESYPNMTDEQIVQLFPELQDILHLPL